MKTLIIFTSLYMIMVFQSLACQLSIPESYVPTFLNPPVSGHYEKCESEPCHCIDTINPFYAELVDNVVLDYIAKTREESCEDELDCDNKFVALSCLNDSEKVKNYDLLQVYCVIPVIKVDGKKLVESHEKKLAYMAAEQAAKDKEKSDKDAIKLLKLSIKEEIKEATTVAKLRELVEKMIKIQE